MWGLVGLAMKAGKVIVGDTVIRKAIRLSQVHLLLVATDASNRTKRTIITRARTGKIPLIEPATKIQLGARLGKQQVAVAAIVDQSFAQAIQNKWASIQN